MSKSSKKRRSDERKKRKQAKKAARRALYLAYAQQGKERKRPQRIGDLIFNHAAAACGNVGCKKCNPSQNVRQFHGAFTGIEKTNALPG
jgi:hypothetical protein